MSAARALVPVEVAPREVGWGAALARIDDLQRAVQGLTRVEDVKTIRDQAEAVRAWARARHDAWDLQLQAAELRLRAERRLGELLPPVPTHAEAGRRGGRGRKARKPSPASTASVDPAALGMSRNGIHRLRLLARVPADAFEEALAAGRERRRIVTAKALLRLAEPCEGEDDDDAGEAEPEPGSAEPPAQPKVAPAAPAPPVEAPAPASRTRTAEEEALRQAVFALSAALSEVIRLTEHMAVREDVRELLHAAVPEIKGLQARFFQALNKERSRS